MATTQKPKETEESTTTPRERGRTQPFARVLRGLRPLPKKKEKRKQQHPKEGKQDSTNPKRGENFPASIFWAVVLPRLAGFPSSFWWCCFPEKKQHQTQEEEGRQAAPPNRREEEKQHQPTEGKEGTTQRRRGGKNNTTRRSRRPSGTPNERGEKAAPHKGGGGRQHHSTELIVTSADPTKLNYKFRFFQLDKIEFNFKSFRQGKKQLHPKETVEGSTNKRRWGTHHRPQDRGGESSPLLWVGAVLLPLLGMVLLSLHRLFGRGCCSLNTLANGCVLSLLLWVVPKSKVK